MDSTVEPSEREPVAPPSEPDVSPPTDPSSDQPIVEGSSPETEDRSEVEKMPEERRLFFETTIRQSEGHTRGLEATLESRRLAETLGRMTAIDAPLLASYLEAKRGLFGEDPPEIMSQELMKIETRLIVPLISDLKQGDLGLTQDQIMNCVVATREAFFGMILNQHLSADKVLEILDGQIKISEKPGQEVLEQHRETEGIISYLAHDKKGQRFNIHLYKDFFQDQNADMAFVLRHEFMHSAALSIWGERYEDFRSAARNPGENIAAFADIPELQQVLAVVANPQLARPFFREYIGKLLDAAQSATDSAHKAFYQQRAAVEIVADLGAHFLEGSRSADVLLDLRARYFNEQDPDKFIQILCQLEDVENQEALFQKYSINPAEVPPREIIRMLSQSERLQALFKTSDTWQEQLAKRFENKGENLKRPEFDETFTVEDMEGFDEMELASAFSTPKRTSLGVGTESSSAGEGGRAGGLLEGFLSIWNIITGKKAT